MGAAAYSRGSGLVAREADAQMPVAHTRAERAAIREERERMLAQIATLERDLARARRALASSRATLAEERARATDAAETLVSLVGHAERCDVVAAPGFLAMHARVALSKLGR